MFHLPLRLHGGAARERLTLAAVVIALSACAAPAGSKPHHAQAKQADATQPLPYARRDDVRRFAQQVAERHGFDVAWVRSQLAAARYQPSVAKAIMPPPGGTAKNWAAYRARFIEPIRVAAGLAFWIANEDALERAEAQYGVPPEIVVGVIGVETIYGRQTGNYRVIDALATLAFDFPTGRSDRSAFFRDELEQLFVLARREGIDATQYSGSYAGAIGLPQFMPSSLNKHAIDFDGDGHIDLQTDAADAIGSVAHYLAESGWTRGMATRYAVTPPTALQDRALLLAPDIVPSFTTGEFAAHGAVLAPEAAGYEGKLALVALQNGDAEPSYVAGTQNFYALTRYNWSSYYAMAVIELGEAVARERQTVPAVR